MTYQLNHLTPGSAPDDHLLLNNSTTFPLAPAQAFMPYQDAPLSAYGPPPPFVQHPPVGLHNAGRGAPATYDEQTYLPPPGPPPSWNGHAPTLAAGSQPAHVDFGASRATDWGSGQIWPSAEEVGMRAPVAAMAPVPQQRQVQRTLSGPLGAGPTPPSAHVPSPLSTMAVPGAAPALVSVRPVVQPRRPKRVSKPLYPCDWKKFMAGVETASSRVSTATCAKSIPEVAVAGAGFLPRVWGFRPARLPEEEMPSPWAFEGAGDAFLLGPDTQWDPVVEEEEPMVAQQDFPRWLDRPDLFWDDAPAVGEGSARARTGGGQAVLAGRVEKVRGRGAGKTARRQSPLRTGSPGRVLEQVVGGQVQRELVEGGPVAPQEHSPVEQERSIE